MSGYRKRPLAISAIVSASTISTYRQECTSNLSLSPRQGSRKGCRGEEVCQKKGQDIYMTDTGCTIWLTGLSGAGKSTLAQFIELRLKERGTKVEVLDGDIVRTPLSKELGFSREDRDTNIKRIAFVCSLLTRNGVVCISAAISPYREA